MKDETYHGDDIKMLREWLSKQPHLPQNIHDVLLRRFLHVCHNSVEKAKNLIDLFYTIRSQAPEIFDDRDPKSPGIQEAVDTVDFLPMPKLTPDKLKVFVYRIKTDNVDKYNFVNCLKAFYLFADVRMVNEEDLAEGEVPVFDMTNFTLKHLTKIVLPVLRKYMVYNQEAHPIQLKEIHLLNVPPYLDRCLAIVRPFMKNEVIHTHLPNSDTIYQFMPREILPEEYGGLGGKCESIRKYWYDKLMENRDYILDKSRWAVSESKRPPNNNHGKQLFGLEGSFRSLNID